MEKIIKNYERELKNCEKIKMAKIRHSKLFSPQIGEWDLKGDCLGS